MSNHETLTPTRNAISLLVSEDGRKHSAFQGGRTLVGSGRVHVRANLSARQASELGILTSGIFGPTGSTSSNSNNLQSSLANRLHLRLADSGSTLFKLTWKQWPIGQQRQICALRASAHRNADNVNGLSPWLTPSARDYKDTCIPRPRKTGRSRLDHVSTQCFLVDHPNAARLTASGEMLTGSIAKTNGGGPLNPQHSRWLMGYEAVWGLCQLMATQSFRKSGKRSSK
jgi:hypothetical protein